nr:hypothetical protein StreXyl84_10200 [Streptomyces sp. Xyl84]
MPGRPSPPRPAVVNNRAAQARPGPGDRELPRAPRPVGPAIGDHPALPDPSGPGVVDHPPRFPSCVNDIAYRRTKRERPGHRLPRLDAVDRAS